MSSINVVLVFNIRFIFYYYEIDILLLLGIKIKFTIFNVQIDRL